MKTRTAKGQLVGSPAALVSPAWRHQNTQPVEDVESRIMISKLPADVAENEIEELFKKTVGPLKDSFIVYNSQGRSKGIAVVTFMRTGAAAVARQKYHGKIVDGRRPIQIEIVVNGYPTLQTSLPPPPSAPSLLERLGTVSTSKAHQKLAANGVTSPTNKPNSTTKSKTALAASTTAITFSRSMTAPNPRIRQKKGPKRVRKTFAQLDKEMDEYRAHVDDTDPSS